MKARRSVDKSRLILKVLLMGIFLTSLSSVAFAETNSSQIYINEQTPTTLNIDEAKEIAAFYLVELSETIPIVTPVIVAIKTSLYLIEQLHYLAS